MVFKRQKLTDGSDKASAYLTVSPWAEYRGSKRLKHVIPLE